MFAIHKGCSLEVIQALLDGGADVFAKDRFARVALEAAIFTRNIPVIQALLDAGASPRGHLSDWDAFNLALELGEPEIAKLFLDYPEVYTLHNIDAAVSSGNCECVRIAMPSIETSQNKAAHLADSALTSAFLGHLPMLQQLVCGVINVAEFPDNAFLIEACLGGRPHVVRWLLCQGCNPNSNNPLMAAFYSGNLVVINLLLAAGAKIDKLSQVSNPPATKYNRYCRVLPCDSCFHAACLSGVPQVVSLALDIGANPNALSAISRNTALHLLCQWPILYIDIIKLLVSRGCNINARNNEEETPLHLAVARKPPSVELVRTLLLLHASLDAKNLQNARPIEKARQIELVENLGVSQFNLVNELLAAGSPFHVDDFFSFNLERKQALKVCFFFNSSFIYLEWKSI